MQLEQLPESAYCHVHLFTTYVCRCHGDRCVYIYTLLLYLNSYWSPYSTSLTIAITESAITVKIGYKTMLWVEKAEKYFGLYRQ